MKNKRPKVFSVFKFVLYLNILTLIFFLNVVSADSPMTTATRTSGIAPLLVVFDPVDLSNQSWSSGVVQPGVEGYASFYYSWNYGDNNSGTWTNDGKSKNTDVGMIASHVYETSGLYNATLSITIPNDTVYTYYQTINVTDFSGTTYYVASSGNDSNNGTDTSHPLKTYSAGIAKASTNTRILFNRGDIFNSSGVGVISSSGPGIVGSYGSGALPIIQDTVADQTGILAITGNDWRIMDIEFIGNTITPGQPTWTAIQGGTWGANADNLLLLRLTISAVRVGGGWGDSSSPTGPNENKGFVECNIHDDYDYGLFLGGRHIAIIGNIIRDTVNSHLVRMWQGIKNVISHNYLARPGGTRLVIKLHAYPQNRTDDPVYNRDVDHGWQVTQYVQISDNDLEGLHVWGTALGPSSSAGYSDERVSDVIYERNYAHNSSVELLIWGRNITARNNLFYQPSSTDGYAMVVERHDIEPLPENIRIYSNTFYAASTSSHSSPVSFMEISSAASNVFVENNILSMPYVNPNINGNGFYYTYGTGSATTNINNSILNTSDFIDSDNGDYNLANSSSAIGAANYSYYVRDDFTGGIRSSTPDIGALDSSASSVTICGDAIVETGETCDDGNTNSGDGCDSSCQVEVSSIVCGNSIVESGETCDDGNTNSGDGCSATCSNETRTQGSGGGGGGSSNSAANNSTVVANPSQLPLGVDNKNEVIEKVFPQVNNEERKISAFEYSLWFYIFIVVVLLAIGVTIFISLLKILKF